MQVTEKTTFHLCHQNALASHVFSMIFPLTSPFNIRRRANYFSTDGKVRLVMIKTWIFFVVSFFCRNMPLIVEFCGRRKRMKAGFMSATSHWCDSAPVHIWPTSLGQRMMSCFWAAPFFKEYKEKPAFFERLLNPPGLEKIGKQLSQFACLGPLLTHLS